MKKILLSLLVLIPFIQSFAQDTLVTLAYTFPQPVSNFEDRDTANYFQFDSAPGNIWQIGTPSKSMFNSAYSLPLALVTDTLNTYPVGNHSSFEFVVLSDDWTLISFRHRLHTDSLDDGGVVEVSYDNGLTWYNIVYVVQFTLSNFYQQSSMISSNGNQPGFTGRTTWVNSTISTFGGLNYVRFRFTFTSDNINTSKDGWMIDNFSFVCFGTGMEELGVRAPVRVYPNPTQGIISVRAENNVMIYDMKLKDIQGRELLSSNRETLDLSPFAPGLYFLEVSTNIGTYSSRVQRR